MILQCACGHINFEAPKIWKLRIRLFFEIFDVHNNAVD